MSLLAILEGILLGVTIRVINACASLVPILLYASGRRIGLIPPSQSVFPNKVITIPSTVDPKRQIKLRIHVPPSFFTKERKSSYPTYVHFHGSGFCLPFYGLGGEQCTYLAEKLDCMVIDADYAKGPEHPFPACHEDAVDVLRYVVSQEDLFDKDKLAIGGQSSGANIALVVSTQMVKDIASIKSVICWYPATDLSTRGDLTKRGLLGSWIHKSMRRAYLPPESASDLKNPRISPWFAPTELFPPTLFIVGERDALLRDSVELADRLRNDGRDCEIMVVTGAAHGWEAAVLQPDTPLWIARRNAYALVEKRLRKAFGGEF